MTDFASDLRQRFVWAMDLCLESYEVLADGRSFVRSDQDESAIALFDNLHDSVVAIPPASTRLPTFPFNLVTVQIYACPAFEL
jgi:hypothetical protein